MITATYVSATTFTVSGDRTAEFHVGRRVKHVGDTIGYGTIESVSVPVADTQVVLTAASDNLDASLTGVYYGIVGSNEPITSMPIHTHDGDEGSGGNIFASPTFTGQATIPTINLTGGQIAFPATAVPSADPNTLDDYEKGEWSAELRGSTARATTPVIETGYYIKTGDEAIAIVYFNNVDTTGATGAQQVVGLPFTSKNQLSCRGSQTVQTYGLDIPGLYVGGDLPSNSTTVAFQSPRDETSWLTVQIVAAAGKYMQLTVHYITE